MLTFEPVEDSNVLLIQNGVYKESKLYTRDGRMFVKHGAGFAKINPNNSTSVSKLFVKEIHSDQGMAHTIGCDLIWRKNNTKPRPVSKAAAK